MCTFNLSIILVPADINTSAPFSHSFFLFFFSLLQRTLMKTLCSAEALTMIPVALLRVKMTAARS